MSVEPNAAAAPRDRFRFVRALPPARAVRAAAPRWSPRSLPRPPQGLPLLR